MWTTTSNPGCGVYLSSAWQGKGRAGYNGAASRGLGKNLKICSTGEFDTGCLWHRVHCEGEHVSPNNSFSFPSLPFGVPIPDQTRDSGKATACWAKSRRNEPKGLLCRHPQKRANRPSGWDANPRVCRCANCLVPERMLAVACGNTRSASDGHQGVDRRACDRFGQDFYQRVSGPSRGSFRPLGKVVYRE